MKYQLIEKNLYSLKTKQELNKSNSFLYKPNNSEGVLIDLPTNIDFQIWITEIENIINLKDIKYVVIQNFNIDLSLPLKELKLYGVDAKIICPPKNALFHFYPWNIEASWDFITGSPQTYKLDGKESFTVQINPYLNGNLDLITIIPEIKTLFSGSLFSSLNTKEYFDENEDSWFSIINFQRSFLPTFKSYLPTFDKNILDKIKIIAPGRGSLIKYQFPDFINTLIKYNNKTDNRRSKIVNTNEVKSYLLSQNLNTNMFTLNYNNSDNKNNLDLNKFKHKLAESSIDQITNPTTELFNEKFFKELISEEIKERLINKNNGGFLYIQLNDKDYLTTAYNSDTMNRILKNLARECELFIEESKDRFKHRLFHLNRDIFCYYIPEGNIEYFLYIAEKIQNMVDSTTLFTEEISISIGIVTYEELEDRNNIEYFSFLHDRGLFRLKSALKKDSSHINYEVLQESFIDKDLNPPLVVIISSDEILRGVLKFHLTSNGFKIKDFSDCLTAYEYICNNNNVKLIISELYLEKLDGLSLKEKINDKHKLSKIPFILTTSKKADDITKRAHSLDIFNILIKPVSLVEITGISKKLVNNPIEVKND